MQFAARKNHKLQRGNELFTLERATAQAWIQPFSG